MHATKTVALAVSLAFAAGWGVAAPRAAHAQLRVAQWNITNWAASQVATRGSAFQTAIFATSPNGESEQPDVLIAQEIVQGGTPTSWPIASSYQTTGQASVNAFLNQLNTAAGSPGDYAAAQYVPNQGDTGNALFYRTSKIQVLDVTTLGCAFASAPCAAGGATLDVGSGSSQAPRDNQRWHVRLVGYASAGAELYLYSGHFKAGSTTADQVRREPEGWRIRMDANALATANPGANFILGADMNVQSSAQTFYQYLVTYGGSFSVSDPRGTLAGQFFDPINKPGSWNNNSAFSNIHTQEPSTQMDDRHDQLLISAALRDRQGMSYLPATPAGNILAPFRTYSTATPYDANQWNDPNHSYRCWGNDGNHYGTPINTGATNTQVGQAIADALVTTVAGNGHLSVYLDLQVPAKLGAPTGAIDLGTITQGTPTTYNLQITNAADLARWSRNGTGWGIDSLTYSLAITPGPFALSGTTTNLERPASSPPAANTHAIILDTSTTGPKSATLTITSDDPDNPTRTITLTASVTGASATGACCTGSACSTATQAACTGAGGSYQGDNAACGVQGNPTTCCPANFDTVHGVDLNDIFSFLSGWFAGDPRSDFNHSGTIDVQDIFDFLSAWFAGC